MIKLLKAYFLSTNGGAVIRRAVNLFFLDWLYKNNKRATDETTTLLLF